MVFCKIPDEGLRQFVCVHNSSYPPSTTESEDEDTWPSDIEYVPPLPGTSYLLDDEERRPFHESKKKPCVDDLERVKGRRINRRYINAEYLKSLTKQGEEDECEDIVQPMPTVFGRLLCEEKAMEVWDSFISMPESEQNELIAGQEMVHEQTKTKSTKERIGTKSQNKRDPAGKRYFRKISPHIREFLNSENMPKETLLSLEIRLIEFFQSEPEGSYVSDHLNNGERKALHGLVQYLDLCSKSFNSPISVDKRCTRVTNPRGRFVVPTILLTEYLGIR